MVLEKQATEPLRNFRLLPRTLSRQTGGTRASERATHVALSRCDSVKKRERQLYISTYGHHGNMSGTNEMSKIRSYLSKSTKEEGKKKSLREAARSSEFSFVVVATTREGAALHARAHVRLYSSAAASSHSPQTRRKWRETRVYTHAALENRKGRVRGSPASSHQPRGHVGGEGGGWREAAASAPRRRRRAVRFKKRSRVRRSGGRSAAPVSFWIPLL